MSDQAQVAHGAGQARARRSGAEPRTPPLVVARLTKARRPPRQWERVVAREAKLAKSPSPQDRSTGESLSAAQSAAARLREIILSREEGAFLGSQEDLVQQLGVGRVTLKQTARILEHEGLLDVRRGVSGGYYGARPDIGGVERAVAIYLRVKQSGFGEALQVAGVLTCEILRRAALSTDEDGRAKLRVLMDKIAEPRVLSDRPYLEQLEREFTDVICQLADTPLGELMLRVTMRMFFEAPFEILPDPKHGTEWQRARLNECRAILAHDADFAQIVAREFGRVLQSGLQATGHAGRSPVS